LQAGSVAARKFLESKFDELGSKPFETLMLPKKAFQLAFPPPTDRHEIG